jgi:hypothetical protein
MIFGIFVVDESLSILSITTWFGVCDFDDVEERLEEGAFAFSVRFSEDRVHFFQRTVGSLGIEEVDDWNDEGVAKSVSCISWKP